MTTSPLLTLNNGVQLPAIGLGVFQSSPEDTVTAVESAIGDGYRLVDTAASYFNERQVGEGIRRSGISRDHIFIETKVWISDYGYEAALHAFDKSAGKLGVERLDLLLLHQPLPSPYRGGEKRTFDDPTLREIAHQHGKSAAQVMLRWHLQEGRSAIPKSTKAARIAENFAVFDFELTSGELAAIDALDTGVRGGPEPDQITLETFRREIPEA
jgi:diketogulonate reductase-like aldo/keto reductase